jgi:hypothetical protein
LPGLGILTVQARPSDLSPPPRHPPSRSGQKKPSARASCKPPRSLWTARGFFLWPTSWQSPTRLCGRITMNAINVIAPYKHLGMWGLRRSPRRPKPRAVRGGRGRNDRSSGRRCSERRAWLHADSPPRPSPVTSTGSTGCVLMRTAVIGIVARTSIWKAGSVRRCFDISTKRRSKFMRG